MQVLSQVEPPTDTPELRRCTPNKSTKKSQQNTEASGSAVKGEPREDSDNDSDFVEVPASRSVKRGGNKKAASDSTAKRRKLQYDQGDLTAAEEATSEGQAREESGCSQSGESAKKMKGAAPGGSRANGTSGPCRKGTTKQQQTSKEKEVVMVDSDDDFAMMQVQYTFLR